MAPLPIPGEVRPACIPSALGAHPPGPQPGSLRGEGASAPASPIHGRSLGVSSPSPAASASISSATSAVALASIAAAAATLRLPLGVLLVLVEPLLLEHLRPIALLASDPLLEARDPSATTLGARPRKDD